MALPLGRRLTRSNCGDATIRWPAGIAKIEMQTTRRRPPQRLRSSGITSRNNKGRAQKNSITKNTVELLETSQFENRSLKLETTLHPTIRRGDDETSDCPLGWLW